VTTAPTQISLPDARESLITILGLSSADR